MARIVETPPVPDRRFDIAGYDAIDTAALETFPYEYPGRDVAVDIETDEFTAVCPWSGLPDFGTVKIRYLPGGKILELRSLKYYLLSYRNVGIYQEHAVTRMLDDLVTTVDGDQPGLQDPRRHSYGLPRPISASGERIASLMRLRPVAVLAEIGVVAALYAAVTMVLNPLSYGPLQLRVAEILKPLVIWEPHLIPAFVIGNFLGNLTSPFSGPWELIFMPTANLVGASLCRVVGRRAPAAGAALYAFVIAAAVSLLLSVLLKLRYALILLLLGVPAMQAVRRALEPVRRRWVVAE